jgi:hypothetical protein
MFKNSLDLPGSKEKKMVRYLGFTTLARTLSHFKKTVDLHRFM